MWENWIHFFLSSIIYQLLQLLVKETAVCISAGHVNHTWVERQQYFCRSMLWGDWGWEDTRCFSHFFAFFHEFLREYQEDIASFIYFEAFWNHRLATKLVQGCEQWKNSMGHNQINRSLSHMSKGLQTLLHSMHIQSCLECAVQQPGVLGTTRPSRLWRSTKPTPHHLHCPDKAKGLLPPWHHYSKSTLTFSHV